MIRGTMKSELVGNARIWTLTVPVQPHEGELIEWSEPQCGGISPREGVRGWVSSQPSSREGTVLVTVAAEGSRWTVIQVVVPVHSHQYDDEPPVQFDGNGNLYPFMCQGCDAETGNPYAWTAYDTDYMSRVQFKN